MRALTDTWTMTKRSLRHTTRSVDTIITVVLTPIAMLLLFVYVFGGALGKQTGSIDYVDFITPGVVIMTVISGIAYAARASQHGPPEGHHQPLPDHAGDALVGPERTGPVIDAVQPLLLLPRDRGGAPRRVPPGGRHRRLARVLRPSDPLHPGHHLAGHVLRPAGEDTSKAPAPSATSCCC